jgi:hypothetical protein
MGRSKLEAAAFRNGQEGMKAEKVDPHGSGLLCSVTAHICSEIINM